MNCETIRPELKAYVDRELPLLHRLAVRNHVKSCEVCRKEIAEMETVASAIKSDMPDEALSAGLQQRIMQQIADSDAVAEIPESRRPSINSRERKSNTIVFSVVCFACFAVVLAIIASSQMYSREMATTAMGYQTATAEVKGGNLQEFRDSNAPHPTYLSGTFTYDDASSPQTSPDESTSLDRQVHREASLTIQMQDPQNGSDRLEQIVKDAGGYIESSNLSTDPDGTKSAEVVLDAPVAQFDTVLGDIQKLGILTAKNVTGEDITTKVSDANQAEAVLENEVQLSTKYLGNKGRHATWEDEENARHIRVELAEARARVQLVHKLSELGKITVDLSQTPQPAAPVQTGMISTLRGSGSAALQSMADTLSLVISGILWIIVYSPVWLPIGLVARYVIRRKQDVGQAKS